MCGRDYTPRPLALPHAHIKLSRPSIHLEHASPTESVTYPTIQPPINMFPSTSTAHGGGSHRGPQIPIPNKHGTPPCGHPTSRATDGRSPRLLKCILQQDPPAPSLRYLRTAPRGTRPTNTPHSPPLHVRRDLPPKASSSCPSQPRLLPPRIPSTPRPLSLPYPKPT